MFAGVYKGRRVLVTGHTGFKGSWLCRWLERLGAEVLGYSLGPLEDPSHWSLLKPDTQSAFGDIRDTTRLNAVVERFHPEVVFHLAAQPLVHQSYDDPVGTYQTNAMGTLNLLEACRRTPAVRAVVVVTTDKCYENREWDRGYKEDDAMGGYDPYSSSKGCVELLTASYRRSFFHPDHYGDKHHVLIASARAGNVIGGGDWAADRLLPDAVRAASDSVPMRVRSPESTRPWQHVLDPLSGYLLLGQRLLLGDTAAATGWNFGPADSQALTVRTVLDRFGAAMLALQVEYAQAPPRLHEAKLLQLDCTKAREELGWLPVWDSHHAIDHTANWYARFLADRSVSTDTDLDRYLADAAASKQGWVEA